MMPNRKQEFLNAVKTGTIATVDALLREDPALANTGDDSGVSALLLAQYSNQCDVVTRLLMNKSELDVFEAAALGLTERLTPILDADASLLTALSSDGFAPLHLAAHFGHVAAVRLLRERGAPIDAKSRNSLSATPLQSATAGRSLPVVEVLLKFGANVNERQTGNWTALHSAAQHGDLPIVMELLRHGADGSALNAEGKNAATIAREAGHDELAAILEPNRSPEEGPQ
jgi:uncharacterized protein